MLQLKVRLLGISPMIWRRLLVEGPTTLRELHGVIQIAMGWESAHLYLFEFRAVAFGSRGCLAFDALRSANHAK